MYEQKEDPVNDGKYHCHAQNHYRSYRCLHGKIQKYQNAKNKWITQKSDQLDKELNEFVSSIEQQTYSLAKTNHESEIAAKKAEIEEKKKALTKDVNNSKKAKERFTF